jgi:hypothetical protein
MPGCALPITPYARIPPKRRGQRRGILRVDARTRVRDVRKTHTLAVLPPPFTNALIERTALLELRIALLDAKQARRESTDHTLSIGIPADQTRP